MIRAPAMAFFLLALGCRGDDPESIDDDVLIPETTKILDAATVDELIEASPDLSELVFPAGVAPWEPDDVLVSSVHPSLPYGMLRKVTEVRDLGDGTVQVRTDFASLSEAIERGSLDEEFTLDASMIVDQQRNVPVIAAPEAGFFFGYDDLELFDADGDPATRYDRVWLDGSFSFRPAVGLVIDFDGFELQTLQFVLRADQEASLRIRAGREASFAEQWIIEELELAPIIFSIGPLPVVLVPRLQLVVEAEGSVTAELSAGVAASSRPTVGFGYDDGSWEPDVDLSPMAQFDVPMFRDGAKGEAKVKAGPRAELAAYGIAGAYGQLSAFVRADLDSQRDPWWGLYAGLEAEAGLFVRILSATLAEYDFEPAVAEVKLADAGEPAPIAGSQIAPWSRTWGGGRTDVPNQVFETREGGLLVLASSNSFTNSPDDAWILKLDRLGQISWQVLLDGLIGALNGYQRSDGDYIVAAGATGNGTDSSYLVRLDPNGLVRWAKKLEHADDPVAIKAVAPVGDDIFAVGAIGSGVGQDVFVARINSDGGVDWGLRVGGDSDDVPNAMLVDGSRFVVAATTRSFGVANTAGWALGLSQDGDVLWQRVYDQPGPGNELLTGVIGGQDGYRLAGHTLSEALVLEVAEDGALERATIYDDDGYHEIVSAVETRDGGALLVGSRGLGDDADTWLLRLTPTGTVLWSTAYGTSFIGEAAGGIGNADNLAQAVALTDDDGLVVASYVDRDATSWDLWLMKVSGTGIIAFDDAAYASQALSGSFVEIPVEDAATTAEPQAIVLSTVDADYEVALPTPAAETQALP